MKSEIEEMDTTLKGIQTLLNTLELAAKDLELAGGILITKDMGRMGADFALKAQSIRKIIELARGAK